MGVGILKLDAKRVLEEGIKSRVAQRIAAAAATVSCIYTLSLSVLCKDG